MPGCGKSTVGVLLAKRIRKRFVDTDLFIQQQEERLLSEIIEEEGLEAFVRIENEVNASVMAENSVIAPGGSVIYGEEAMLHLREIARVRVENPDLSLQQLGEMLDPPIGKSGVNHRLRRLMEIADGLENEYDQEARGESR